MGSDHLPIVLTVPLSPVFYPNERFPSFNFQKARSIFFSREKRQSQAWWSDEVDEGVSERLLLPLMEVMKIVRLTSLLPDILRLSSPNPKLRYDKRLAHFSLNLCIFSFVLSLALLFHLSPLFASPTVSLPGSRLWSSPIT